ncbi:MAG TPA: M48 family metalloprotease [Terracidiphilus sp.]|nr:M48 family metalloprotease [Terracidiphilus sp.]
MRRKLLGSLLLIIVAHGAAAVEPACSLQMPTLRVKRADIFTDQQEQWLGDAQADMIEPRYTLLPADESSYLDEIGQRLLKQLPPTPIHYTFRIYESPDLRAFSLAGGHVYISRKLIMDARDEDELAAMLAQEIGRIYIHHAASAITRRMKRVMHVEKLGDRADVYDNFERMFNLQADSLAFLTPDDQRDDELLADRVGMYAMIKAHYDPKAFAAFLDRVNDNGGFTGNLFTAIFDATPLISLRVRMADKLVSSLPASCRGVRPIYRAGFGPFQQAIQQQRINPIVPATPGLDSVALQQPIHPALENVVISPDGKYVLAQDAYQIHVLSASPPKLLFSADALGAEMAQFTPDSQGLVFNYNDLHVERWQLDTGKPSNIQDFVDYAGCVQTSLSPDGNVLACVSQFYSAFSNSVWLKLGNIQDGSMLYQNLHFFDKDLWVSNPNIRITPTFQALMHWSRDGRYFVAASGTSAMAYDLRNGTTVHLGGGLSGLAQQRFAFAGSDKMVSTCDWSEKTGGSNETFTMCYTTFPDGQSLDKFQLPPGWLASVAGGDDLLFGPLSNASSALIDPATKKIDAEFQDEPVDLHGDEVAYEIPSGGLEVGKLQGGDVQSADLPVTPLSTIEASAFSPNGRYLAVSNRARGAEWDLSTDKRMALTSPFRAATIDDSGALQAAIIHHELVPSSNPGIDRLTHKYVPWLSPLNDPLQLGSIRVRFKPLSFQMGYDGDVDMEAFDARTEAHLWSKTFTGLVPGIDPADGDKTVFVTDRDNWTGGAKLIHTSDLPRQFLNPLGTVVEVISNRTGKPEGAFFSPQLAVRDGDDRSAGLFGTLLAVHGNNNDTTVYRVPGGIRLFAFFGSALAGDDTLGMVAATDRIQELNIYETAHGKRLAHYLLDQAVIAARFVPERKQLLVLTASQTVYRIDLSKFFPAN